MVKKALWIALALVTTMLAAGGTANACKSCGDPSNWDPNCADAGCTYCVACEACCPGGDFCDLYCGGGPAAAKKMTPVRSPLLPGVTLASSSAAAAPASALGLDARSAPGCSTRGTSFAAWLGAKPLAAPDKR